MKNKFLSLGAALLVLSVAEHFFARPLLAAVAALTKNIDERGRNPYVQSAQCYSASSNICYAVFPTVPANMRLVVEHVNMSLDTPSPFSDMNITGNGSISEEALMGLQGHDPTGNNIYVANQPFLMYYEAGQSPSVGMFSQAAAFQFMSGQVTLTGYLVNLSE